MTHQTPRERIFAQRAFETELAAKYADYKVHELSHSANGITVFIEAETDQVADFPTAHNIEPASFENGKPVTFDVFIFHKYPTE